MALGALAGVVAGRSRMAGLAIGEAVMVEGYACPVVAIVAQGALAGVVIGGSAVAGLAIVQAVVIEGNNSPVGYGVA